MYDPGKNIPVSSLMTIKQTGYKEATILEGGYLSENVNLLIYQWYIGIVTRREFRTGAMITILAGDQTQIPCRMP